MKLFAFISLIAINITNVHGQKPVYDLVVYSNQRVLLKESRVLTKDEIK